MRDCADLEQARKQIGEVTVEPTYRQVRISLPTSNSIHFVLNLAAVLRGESLAHHVKRQVPKGKLPSVSFTGQGSTSYSVP